MGALANIGTFLPGQLSGKLLLAWNWQCALDVTTITNKQLNIRTLEQYFLLHNIRPLSCLSSFGRVLDFVELYFSSLVSSVITLMGISTSRPLKPSEATAIEHLQGQLECQWDEDRHLPLLTRLWAGLYPEGEPFERESWRWKKVMYSL